MSESKILRSYVCGRWHEAERGFVPIVNPATEEVVGRVSSEGVDFAAVLDFALSHGRSSLRRLTYMQRAEMIKEMSKILRQNREELLELSRLNNGTTQGDGAFDVDGASGTLAYYAGLGRGLGERNFIVEGDRLPLSREGSFAAQHILAPRAGVAVHINAFNFPTWGFAEKAACALLAGMPIVAKPATSTALLTERCIELIADANILPQGALQFVCGSLGDLMDRLGPQDVVAFTGSAETAETIRARLAARGARARLNIEADSLNAAILAPDVLPDSPTMELFLREVVREITQKAGQKCTAVRRILVPAESVEEVQDLLRSRLESAVVGDPSHEDVTMGPLATKSQLKAAEDGVAVLAGAGEIVVGTGRRVDGVGAETGKGYFFAPTLIRWSEAPPDSEVHHVEVFAPVASLVSYDGDADRAAEINGMAEGTLVTSLYTDDLSWLESFTRAGAATTGRLYVGSADSMQEMPGSGAALPQTLHGGPGRAGSGEELGGLIGVALYMQRMALQGSPAALDRVTDSSQSSS